MLIKIFFLRSIGSHERYRFGDFPLCDLIQPDCRLCGRGGGFPAKIDKVIGVAKAFSSAVGAGPFPTEEFGGTIDILRGTGEKPDDEFGARTGRSRRLGWIDIPVLKYTHAISKLLMSWPYAKLISWMICRRLRFVSIIN